MTTNQVAIKFGLAAQGLYTPPGVADTTLNTIPLAQNADYTFSLTQGTGSGQVNAFAYTTRQLAKSTSESLDLTGTTLKTMAGETITFTSVKAVRVRVLSNPDGSTASTSMEVGGAGSNENSLWFKAAGDIAVVKGPTACPFVQGDPAGVTVDATHKLVKIANADASNLLTYEILVAGVSS